MVYELTHCFPALSFLISSVKINLLIFRVYLESAYFAEIKIFLLKSTINKCKN